jgi:hypothetical protein
VKKFLKIISAIIVVIAIALGAVFYFTADMVTAADNFFNSVEQGNVDEAYSKLSEDFKNSTSESELIQFLQLHGFDKFKQASWDSRSINGGSGTLKGSITTESDGVIPVSIDFVKTNGGWKIYSMVKPQSGIQTESSPLQVPDEQNQVKLVNESMLVFAQSVKEKSMSKFHQHVSNVWQQSYTIAQLDEAFGVFYELESDLRILKNFSPVFDSKPIVNDEGNMVISGQYPTKPSKMYFKQTYVYEGLSWKLIGFSANIK